MEVWRALAHNRGMEAFDFDYALRKARRGLEMQLVEYAAEHPEMGYRELREAFGLSLGAISKIMRQHNKLLRTLIRKKGSTASKESAEKSGAVRHLFSLDKGLPMSVLASSGFGDHVSGDLQSQDVELALKTLDRCVVEEKPDDPQTMDSYRNLVNWLKKRGGSKTQRDRAKYLVQRCEKLGRARGR
jgi:hypothetical protein